MLRFTPVDSYQHGQQTIFTGFAPEASAEERGADWVGQRVQMGELSGVIRAVESRAMPRTINAGDPVGLWVDLD